MALTFLFKQADKCLHDLTIDSRVSRGLNEEIDEALAEYGTSRSKEAEETGRTVTTLQD